MFTVFGLLNMSKVVVPLLLIYCFIYDSLFVGVLMSWSFLVWFEI